MAITIYFADKQQLVNIASNVQFTLATTIEDSLDFILGYETPMLFVIDSIDNSSVRVYET